MQFKIVFYFIFSSRFLLAVIPFILWHAQSSGKCTAKTYLQEFHFKTQNRSRSFKTSFCLLLEVNFTIIL
jgi:hypothetical protein